MRRAASLLLLIAACQFPGEPGGPCDANLACVEGYHCHAQYDEEPDEIITMCIAFNPSNDPWQCKPVQVAEKALPSWGMSTCRVPCDSDLECYPELGLVCGVTGSCGWE